jgi:hypothetical protein
VSDDRAHGGVGRLVGEDERCDLSRDARRDDQARPRLRGAFGQPQRLHYHVAGMTSTHYKLISYNTAWTGGMASQARGFEPVCDFPIQ